MLKILKKNFLIQQFIYILKLLSIINWNKMKTVKFILVITLLISFIQGSTLQAQCSDAGVCVVGSDHSSGFRSKSPRNNINFDYSLALSGNPDKITYNLFRFSSEIYLDNEYSVFISVPLQFETSKVYNANNGGLGDVLLMLNKSFAMQSNNFFNLQIGAKLPTSSIAKRNFLYFNGYGTLDIIAGASCTFSNFNFGLFAQLPVTTFKEDLYNFERGADIMLRGAYKFYLDDWAIKLECLAIKRLKESSLTVKTFTPNVTIPITNSDFFQLNGIVGAEYKINRDFLIDLNAAVPFLQRKENSDGTKRAFTIQTGIKYSFN